MHYQGWWDKQMMADYFWKRDLKNIKHDRKRKFYHSSYVYKDFISAVSLLNDLIKILVGLCIFNHVIFKDIGSDCYCQIVFLNKQTNICWFKYKLREFYDFTLRNIAISQYHIYRKQTKKIHFSKNEAFLLSKSGS